MIRQICNVKPEDVATIRSNKLLKQLEIDELHVILREKRLCWFGHFEPSSGAIKTAVSLKHTHRCKAWARADRDVMEDIDRERLSRVESQRG